MPEPINSLLDLPYTSLNWIEGGYFLFQNKVEVTFGRGFYAGVYPVTQEFYKKVMGINPSYFKGKHRPVERVSWNDAHEFLKQLNVQTKDTFTDGKTFRLPTEALWEYCARNYLWEINRMADTQRYKVSDYSGSHFIGEVGWSNDNSRSGTQPVGLKEPNMNGLFDMSGNVTEFTEDWYHNEISSGYSNGFRLQNETKKDRLVVRGGAWILYGSNILNRNYRETLSQGVDTGFRIFRF